MGYKLKRATMRVNGTEKQIRPPKQIYTYSYTFKWKTAAEIWNERTTLVWTVSTNSNWVTSSWDLRIAKDVQWLATAKRIIISGTYVSSSAYSNAGSLWIGIGSGWGTSSTWWDLQWTQHAWIRVYSDWDAGSIVWNTGAWTYNPELTIDLQNKEATLAISWFSDSTIVLTDTKITKIMNYTYMSLYLFWNATWSDISITIEY